MIVTMDNKSDIGYHTEKIVPVLMEKADSVIIVCCKKYLRTSSFPEDLLILVKGIPYSRHILLKDKSVKERQICRIISHRVLNQEDALDSPFENIVISIHAVLEELHYCKNKVGLTVPAENIIDGGPVAFFNLAIYFSRERGKENYRSLTVI